MEAIFNYDLGEPECYLVAERIAALLPVTVAWEPVSWPPSAETALDRGEIERVARDRGLQPVRWPERWPPNSRLAMLAATYAKHIGRVTAFSLAAFRQAFAGGRDLADADTLLIAAAACEMHPAALLKGIGMNSVERSLERATADARAAGATRVPAIRVGEHVFEGDRGVEEAAAALSAVR